MQTILGLFEQEQDADLAIRMLQKEGFDQNRFGVVSPNRVLQKVNQAEEQKQGTVHADRRIGTTEGATAGGLTGLLVGAATLAIPGVGPVVAAGTLASTLGSVAAATGLGTAAGGLLGTLMSLGVSEDEADFYAEGVKRGGILVVVKAEDDHVATVRDSFGQAGALKVKTRRRAWQAAGWTGFDESESPGPDYPKFSD